MIYSLAPQYVMYGSQKYLAQVRNEVLEYTGNSQTQWYWCSWTPVQMVSVDGAAVDFVEILHPVRLYLQQVSTIKLQEEVSTVVN